MKHVLLFVTFALSAAPAVAAADCDRDCLRGSITQYLNAMIAHNPSELPVSDKVRFTEDTVEMRLGEGLWKNASRVRPYRQDILDVREGIAATRVVVESHGERPIHRRTAGCGFGLGLKKEGTTRGTKAHKKVHLLCPFVPLVVPSYCTENS